MLASFFQSCLGYGDCSLADVIDRDRLIVALRRWNLGSCVA